MLSIKKNLIYNSTYQILVVIAPLITSPYISRILGANGIGIYSYNYTVANYFLIFAMLGVTKYGNRSIAKVRDDKVSYSKVFWSIYFFQLITSIISVCLYFLYITLIKKNVIIALVESLVVVSAVFDITWLFFGLEQFKITTIRSILVKISTVVSILLFVKSKDDLWIYCFIMSFGILANQILLWVVVKKYLIWVKPSRNEVFEHFRPNLMLFLPVIAISLFSYLDRIMLGFMSSYTELGYFDNAEKITSIPLSLITAMGTVMLPRISYLSIRDNEVQEKRLNRLSMSFAVIMSSSFSFGIMSVSKYFVPFFFGSGFKPVIILLLIMAPKMIFISWSNIICNQYLLPYSRDALYTMSVFGGAVINIVLNLLLIPKYGAIGTALASFLTELLISVLQTFFSIKHMEIDIFLKDSIPFIFSAVLMYLIIKDIYFKNILVSLFLQILCGAFIFTVLSLFFMIMFRKGLAKIILNSVIKNKKLLNIFNDILG